VDPLPQPEAPHKEERARVYAAPVPTPFPVSPPLSAPPRVEYREANPADIAVPDHSRFYDALYRPELRKMVDHVIAVEAPLYFELLVDRLSRAHGFQRAKHTIRETIQSALGRGRYTETEDDGRVLIWPAGADVSGLTPWRGTGGRNHSIIPLVELASLVASLAAEDLDEEVLIRRVQYELDLARLATGTRERLSRALALARRYK
jgi:hypothetical protein